MYIFEQSCPPHFFLTFYTFAKQTHCKFDLKTPFFSPVNSTQTFVKLRKLSTYTYVSTINYHKIVCKTVSALKV